MPSPSRRLPSPRVVVSVEQQHIVDAVPRDSGHCMIADALAQAVPNAAYISVDLATIRFSDLAAGRRYIFLTPRKAQMALLAFDQGQRPEPFGMTLCNAHVIATGSARRGKAKLVANDAGNSLRREGGNAPPVGPLQGGAPKQRRADKSKGEINFGAGAGNRTGRRREFGLRGFIR